MKLKDMKIYLLDIDDRMCEAWKFVFRALNNVHIVNEDLNIFLSNHDDIDCLVSPANSFGLMDGGYDLAISQWYRNKNIEKVQNQIKSEYFGEQTVGTAITVNLGLYPRYLIHSPTMTVPTPIRDESVIYNCMRATLIEALKNNIKVIVIPAFGGGCGFIHPMIIAKNMYVAYRQLESFLENDYELTWQYARYIYGNRE